MATAPTVKNECCSSFLLEKYYYRPNSTKLVVFCFGKILESPYLFFGFIDCLRRVMCISLTAFSLS